MEVRRSEPVGAGRSRRGARWAIAVQAARRGDLHSGDDRRQVAGVPPPGPVAARREMCSLTFHLGEPLGGARLAKAVRGLEGVRGVGRVRCNAGRNALRLEPCPGGDLSWPQAREALAREGVNWREATLTAVGTLRWRPGGLYLDSPIGKCRLSFQPVARGARADVAGAAPDSRVLLHGVLREDAPCLELQVRRCRALPEAATVG